VFGDFMHLTDLRQGLPRVFENLFACRGQQDIARGALYQSNAEFFLQLFELRGQGGLTDETGFGGATEMAGIGECYEITQITEIHAGILIQYVYVNDIFD
jgi:hypothetical protein